MPASFVPSGSPSTTLARGDLLPSPPESPAEAPSVSAAREAAEQLARCEPPGINTLVDGHTELVLQEALGANVLDADGRRFIDLIGGFGVALLGHRHPRVVEAIVEQSGKLLHGLGDVYANKPRIRLGRALCELAPFDYAQAYFAVSGADAVEIALKTAVLATGRSRILAFDPGYHGVTLGALQVCSRPAFRQPFAAHAGSHVTRLPFGCDPLRFDQLLADRSFAAVVFEPVVGREGVIFPPDGWIDLLLESARATGTISIADEIFAGLHRTGPLFAHRPRATAAEHPAAASADLICCGKALGGGLPIGAVLGRRQLFEEWGGGGEALHTGTFVAHPVACAAALAVLTELQQPWVAERLASIGEAFGSLRCLLDRPGVVDVRGRGALWAIEFATQEAASQYRKKALGQGLLLLAGGPEGRVVQLVPPLVLTDLQLDYAVTTLTSV